MKDILQNHTAGAQAIGFDYQFYYFMFLLLQLKVGEKIGFEVKDDIHIDMPDGTTILFQTKHSTRTNTSGEIINLTNLDTDLWKTLSNWSEFIKNDKDFINQHSFVLVTNKDENNNIFIDSVLEFSNSKNLEYVLKIVNDLKSNTTDKILKKYISNFLGIGKKKQKLFLNKLSIETGNEKIIQKIKNRILENVRQEEKYVDIIYNNLYSNLQTSKFLDIKEKNKFEVSFDDFNKKFGSCFKVAIENNPLPKRNFPVILPADIESQPFIQQLLDIGETHSGSNDIKKYTTHMLQFINDFTYWTEEENFLLLTEAEEFKENSITIWANEFKSKYRDIQHQINNGIDIEDLENDIKILAIEIVDFIRKKDLTLKQQPLGLNHSNGHFYALSNDLEIGWHFNWEAKYKKR